MNGTIVGEQEKRELAAKRQTAARAAHEIPAMESNRHRFLEAVHCQRVDHPPIWLMRQAGRVLPEYRALKEKHPFLELVQTPELAAEVTLQPIRRFDFDAAIIFSDILVVPEAMGQSYHFCDAGGIKMQFQLRSADDIARLDARDLELKLEYVARAIRLVKPALAGRTALLGFAGSPWTLANFMLEGGSSRHYSLALKLFHENRALFDALCHKLSMAVIHFLRMQIAAGVDAVQIFDSHGGLIPTADFDAVSGRWIKEIITGLGGLAPVIVFSKGCRNWDALANTGARVIGVDHDVRLANVRTRLPATVAIQGNLDPNLLVTGTTSEIAIATRHQLNQMRGRPGYIFNLGHGVPPTARLENISQIIQTIRHPA